MSTPISGPHGLAIRRALLAITIVGELAFGAATWLWLDAGYRSPLHLYLGLAALLSALLAGTWLSDTLRAHARELAVLTMYLASGHTLYLTWLNHLDPHYVMFLCMLEASVIAASVYCFRSSRDLLVYLLFFGAGATWVLLAVDEPRTEPTFFALAMATLVALTYVAVSALLRAVNRERESRRRHELVVRTSPDPMLRIRHGEVIDAPALGGVLGEGLRASIGRPVGELLPERADEVVAALDTVLRIGTPQRVEGTLQVHGGDKPLTVELRFVRMSRDEALVYARDRTEERRLEQHLVQSDRLASVGTLAFGIAHEINNPLSFVQNNTEWVIEALGNRPDAAGRPPRKQLVEALEDVREGGNRIRQIVSDLLLSAQRGGEDGHAEVASSAESALKLARGHIRHRAELDVELDTLPPLAISESALVQVLLNLLVNAAQALPGRAAHRNRIVVRARARGDGRAQLEVQDNGSGIPEGQLERVLEPFFTTKPPGMGTGLGLYVTHQLVIAAGGELDIDSTEGSGTTVRVLLPLAEGVVPGEPAASRPVPSRGRSNAPGARVLVVDDDPAVARALRRSLHEHDVRIAAGGAEALEALGSETFDVVISDLMMPGISGIELYERADEETRARMIFVTGGAFDAETREVLAQVAAPVLHKPLDLDELREAIAGRLPDSEQPAGTFETAG